MRTSVQIFRAGIKELMEFLSITEQEAELVGLLLHRKNIFSNYENQLLTQIVNARTDRKRYLYTVAIVSLYGILERYIDTLIEAFIAKIAKAVVSYDRMPEKIQDNHIPLSIALVKAIGEERHRTDMTPKEVIANLHSCLSGDINFRVNGSAFVLHRGNISLAKITEYLSLVGISNHMRRITLSTDFINFFQERNPERDVRRVADQDLYSLLQSIDDLVDRRNQVSHGVIVIDDIESIDLLKERCCFVSSYGNALYNIFIQEALRYQINHADSQRLGKPIKVFQHSIVCFEASNFQIAVGNTIAAATENELEPFRYGEILSLEIDGNSVPEITTAESTKFGAKVSFKASDKYDYYILKNVVI